MEKLKRLRELGFSINYRNVWAFTQGQIGGVIPGLHHGMFETTLEYLGDKHQSTTILQQAKNYEVLGCYAQTEIGHGSNVQALETIASYDKETEEFVLNSPTLTSGKCWPGELGCVATHAILHAQLWIGEKCHGV